MNQAVLVTGAAGFIGSHLVERLVHLGYRVVGLDNFNEFYSSATKWGNISAVQHEDSFQLVQGDIRDAALLNRVFSDSDISIVIHLAALAGVRPSLQRPVMYQDVNIGGTLGLLEASRTSGVEQFVFASSSSVYGLGGEAPFTEEMEAARPISPYAASKRAGELFCSVYSHLYGLRTVVLRLFTVYGPRQRPDMAICRFVRMVDHGEEISVFGNGTVKRDFTYISDIVAGFEAALAYQTRAFEIFNLGSGKAIVLGHVLKLLRATMSKKPKVKRLPLPLGDVPITLADISKARAILGYEPNVSIEEGISLFVQWYLQSRGQSREGVRSQGSMEYR